MSGSGVIISNWDVGMQTSWPLCWPVPWMCIITDCLSLSLSLSDVDGLIAVAQLRTERSSQSAITCHPLVMAVPFPHSGLIEKYAPRGSQIHWRHMSPPTAPRPKQVFVTS
jgi:hypothetical protein